MYKCHFFIILLGYYLQFSFNISYFLQGLPILSHLPLLFSKNVVKKLNFSAFMFVEVDHNSICFHSQWFINRMNSNISNCKVVNS